MPKASKAAAADPAWKTSGGGQSVIPVNGDSLRYYRTHRKGGEWSQYKLARETGLSRSYISEIESGIKQPREFAAEKLAEVLGVTTDDLVESPPEATT